MSQPALRDYQAAFIERFEQALAKGRRPMGVAPTDAGKTMIAAEIARRAVARGERLLFLVHRRELVPQTAQKLHAAGLEHGLLAAGRVIVDEAHHAQQAGGSVLVPQGDAVLRGGGAGDTDHCLAERPSWRR